MKIVISVLFLLIFIGSCSSQSIEQEKDLLFSVIDLPADLLPIETIEDWYPNGDGYYLSRFKIEDEAMKLKIFGKLKKNPNANDLPFGNEIIDDLIFDYVDDEDEGLYLLNSNRNDPRDIQLIVWNITKSELFFLISYQ